MRAKSRGACQGGGAVIVIGKGRADAPVGNPLVVTVNVPARASVNVVVLVLVMAGAWLTVRVKDWVALGVTPLLAVIVMG